MRLLVVTPVFDDGACLAPLLTDLARADLRSIVDVLVVDDGSTTAIFLDTDDVPDGLGQVDILRLGTNVGHQRAIAVGLVEAAQRGDYDAVAVIDSDGEDRPEDLTQLLRALDSAPHSIVVAQRRNRTEAVRFRAFYSLYRMLFRMLTGRRLDFGNFTVVPIAAVHRLVLMPELWNHYPATLMRSRLVLTRVPTDRGRRYAGRSRMNFTALVNHGLAGIAAFVDTAFARLLVLASAATAIFGLAILGAVVLRLTIGVPIPGWAALGASVAAIGLIQVLAGLVVVSFMTLAARSTVSPPPVDFAANYVVKLTRVT